MSSRIWFHAALQVQFIRDEYVALLMYPVGNHKLHMNCWVPFCKVPNASMSKEKGQITSWAICCEWGGLQTNYNSWLLEKIVFSLRLWITFALPNSMVIKDNELTVMHINKYTRTSMQAHKHAHTYSVSNYQSCLSVWQMCQKPLQHDCRQFSMILASNCINMDNIAFQILFAEENKAIWNICHLWLHYL